MASAIASPPPERSRRRSPPLETRRLSPLTRRILAVNVLALVILLVGLLYLDRYQTGLIESEIGGLHVQAGLIAGAIGEGAVSIDQDGDASLAPEVAQALVWRLANLPKARVRLFDLGGTAIADSSARPFGEGAITGLPPDEDEERHGFVYGQLLRLYELLFDTLPRRDSFPPYTPKLDLALGDQRETRMALNGESADSVSLAADGHLVFLVAEPVQRYRRVLGVLTVTRRSVEMDDSLRHVRAEILVVFSGSLAITVLLSLYLAGTIARPIRRLALAANRVGAGRGRPAIPDFGARGDEIGDLSIALRQMTGDLWRRMEAVESFAADVAHEIKNPLTSLRSAVETAARITDPVALRRLTAIILDDVDRLDRLITDISQASRLDAQLARATPEPVDLGALAEALASVHEATRDAADPSLSVVIDRASGPPTVLGLEDRLAQVLRNLIANAISFSPAGGTITLSARKVGGMVEMTVEDEGPGLPEGKAEAIFDRFYTERPAAEKFGTHSGLGLSISRQIIEAHGGRLFATNRRDRSGARFTIEMPGISAIRPGGYPA